MWDILTISLAVWAYCWENKESQIFIESIKLFLLVLNVKADKNPFDTMDIKSLVADICSKNTETLQLGNLVISIYNIGSFQGIQGSYIYKPYNRAGSQRQNDGSRNHSREKNMGNSNNWDKN